MRSKKGETRNEDPKRRNQECGAKKENPGVRNQEGETNVSR
jgi:hypothetical protein